MIKRYKYKADVTAVRFEKLDSLTVHELMDLARTSQIDIKKDNESFYLRVWFDDSSVRQNLRLGQWLA
ncbi:MAG: hypothetical protein MI744_08170, partial [Pseudomonadales bacterium]|nr:hypothetical protein [Pseudomonadales bacterium]